MIRAIFFDLDDTLCDFQPAWEKAIWKALNEVSSRSGVGYEELLSAWQESWRELMVELGAGSLDMAGVRARRFGQTFSKVNIDDADLADEVDLLLGGEMLEQLRLYDDTDVLDRLRGEYKLAIVTNGADDEHPDSQRSKALRLGLLERVDAFFASDAHGARKPDPALLLAAAQSLGVEPAEVLFVGDSVENDVVAANRAGMVSVLLWRRPFDPPFVEGEQKPQHLLVSLRGLERLVS